MIKKRFIWELLLNKLNKLLSGVVVICSTEKQERERGVGSIIAAVQKYSNLLLILVPDLGVMVRIYTGILVASDIYCRGWRSMCVSYWVYRTTLCYLFVRGEQVNDKLHVPMTNLYFHIQLRYNIRVSRYLASGEKNYINEYFNLFIYYYPKSRNLALET